LANIFCGKILGNVCKQQIAAALESYPLGLCTESTNAQGM
jgi:hypothetical protein